MLEVEPQIIESYVRAGQVRIVYRHLLQLGEASELLAEASECAADQGKFWEIREQIYRDIDMLYNNTRANVEQLATGLGIDGATFSSCLDAETHREAVQADFAAAEAEGVRSRPVFRIGEQQLVGVRPFEIFQQVLDSALKN